MIDDEVAFHVDFTRHIGIPHGDLRRIGAKSGAVERRTGRNQELPQWVFGFSLPLRPAP
ncbi:MAG: hypothetical protein ACJLS3_00195 [Erythrobacter sp.]